MILVELRNLYHSLRTVGGNVSWVSDFLFGSWICGYTVHDVLHAGLNNCIKDKSAYNG